MLFANTHTDDATPMCPTVSRFAVINKIMSFLVRRDAAVCTKATRTYPHDYSMWTHQPAPRAEFAAEVLSAENTPESIMECSLPDRTHL